MVVWSTPALSATVADASDGAPCRQLAPCDAEAVRWYRLAAEQGHAGAQFNLGVMYFGGRGVLKDFVLAHMWLNIVGTNGQKVARENRDKLERVMTRAEISRATELARMCMDSDYQDCAP